MIRLLIFDLDGTLFASGPGIHSAVNEIAARRGLAPLPYEKVIHAIGGGLLDLLHKVYPHEQFAQHLWPVLIEEFREIYKKYFLTGSTLYPGTIDFLKSWPHQLAIASNKTEFFVKAMVENSLLNEFKWEMLLGGDSLPEKKPHPLQLQTICQKAAVSPQQTLMIGDSHPDIAAASAAGAWSCYVRFGYGKVESVPADYEINHFSELTGVISSISLLPKKPS